MEPHPVPQNIIDVEFKLFGAFSLRQFGMILMGCMVGVVIYFIPVIPFIVKVPLIFIAVMAGILSAIIPNFGTWMAGFAKALIVAPRYVWIKEPAHNDILDSAEESAQKSKTSVSNSLKAESQKLNLDSLVISDAVKEKDDVTDDFLIDNEVSAVQKKNFSQVYDKVFDGIKPTPPVNNSIGVNNIKNQQPSQVKSEDAKPTQIPPVAKQTIVNQSATQKTLSIEEILKQIESLKLALSEANKKNDKEMENSIINRINDLYNQYKVLKSEVMQSKPAPDVKAQNLQMKKFLNDAQNGKMIFGLVVTKSDRPVEGANVLLANLQTQHVYEEKTSKDGKFATKYKLPIGSYNIRIEHPTLKFHTYKIDVTEGRLPAFKFREK